MSKHRVLGFKPCLRLEGRGQDGQNETEQPDHSAKLRRFRHLINSDRLFGTHNPWKQTFSEPIGMSQRCQYRKSAGVIRSPYRRGLGGFGTKMTDSLGSTPQSSLPEGARGTEWRLLTKLFK